MKLELPWKILRHFVRLKPSARLCTKTRASQPAKVTNAICNKAPLLATALICCEAFEGQEVSTFEVSLKQTTNKFILTVSALAWWTCRRYMASSRTRKSTPIL